MRNSYHTDLILQYQLNSLPQSITQQIPSSTRSNWKRRDLSNLFGCSHTISPDSITFLKTIARQEKLLQAGKAVYFVLSTLLSLWQTITIPKQQRKHFQVTILKTITQIQPMVGLKRTLRWFKLSYCQYHTLLKKQQSCKLSFFEFCNHRWPNQLTLPEVSTIKNILLEPAYQFWSLSSVYYQMMREGKGFCGLSTFYRYAKALGIQRPLPKHRRKKHTIGIRTTRPLEILHMDVTIFRPLDNTKVYLYFIVDNFSRAILGWKASLTLSADICLENLKEVVAKYHLDEKATINLITDDGTENTAYIIDEFLDKTPIEKLIAQKDILQSNSMVESINKHVKYCYLFTRPLKDFKEVLLFLTTAIPNYNQKPHGALHGFTPEEVLQGQIPSKDHFKAKIQIAKAKRVETNRKNNCPDC